MKNYIRLALIALLIPAITEQVAAQKKEKPLKPLKILDYTKLVDPFIGTGGHGHTYPGASLPFGMVQLSPDTRLEGWDGCSGYHYTDSLVYGFSHTHLSGTGIADYCDILFMPTTGDPKLLNTEYSSQFSKKNEVASPGSYKTKLDKYDIGVELTATRRVGMHRYNYPNTAQANIIIDLQHRDEVLDSWIEVINDHEIKGYRRSKSWAPDQTVYFYAKFSRPFKSYGIAVNNQIQNGQQKAQGKNVKMYLQFDNPGEVISKVGISSVSAEGALSNLDKEVPDFDFKAVQKSAKVIWNEALAKIQVEGGAPQMPPQPQQMQNDPRYSNRGGATKVNIPDYSKIKQTIFYTALYHTMLAPNVYSDVDGQYRGLDQKIHKAEGFEYYSVFSLWDTFRAEHPLLTIIDPKRTLDFIKTFLAQYDDNGILPVWPLASSETFCMIGNHAIPVIVDAYAKGIRGFDAEKAFKAMKISVNRNQFGLDSYRKNGVVLADEEHESVSKTLEYAYDDYCIALMAKMLNKPQDYNQYIKSAQNWKNVYDGTTGFMRARVNGGWFSPFNPTDVNNNYTEANGWQSFYTPQDVESLSDLLGGKDALEAKLDELFTTTVKTTGREQADITGLIGQYAHGNEPSHHMAYLYNFTNEPFKTQFYINRIMNEQYRAQPDGLSGNEDCGQMSAWYVMNALGFYNIAPGQNNFQVGLPAFDRITINLENGKKFNIFNSGTSRTNYYIQGMSLNKSPYNKLTLAFDSIANGGEWEVLTGRLPNKLYMQDIEKPVSRNTENLVTPNPYFIYPSITFKNPIKVGLGDIDKEAKIYYTIDGSAPGATSARYTDSLLITKTTTLKAVAIKSGITSHVTFGTFTKMTDGVKIMSLSPYHDSYQAQGGESLIDGLKGKAAWRLGNWQGFQGNDLEAVLDLGQPKIVKKVSIGTLQDSKAWIVFPSQVDFLISEDGKNFKKAKSIITKVEIKDQDIQTQVFSGDINVKTRYIKLIARQYGKLPKWHESSGNPSYIFADEITVE
ncbi:MAG: GH92 family glycosyl hydrolase [Sphingobacteriaceae bacterium]